MKKYMKVDLNKIGSENESSPERYADINVEMDKFQIGDGEWEEMNDTFSEENFKDACETYR